MKRSLGQRAAVAIVASAFAVGASALFGGVAFAGGEHGHHDNTGGAGGGGGKASANCLIPIGISAGLLAGQGGDVSQCNATGGAGGNGGTGANY